MCQYCTRYQVRSFPTEADFNAFLTILDAKCNDGTFIRFLASDNTEDISYESIYQCSYCNDEWVLSIPDDSWRGYFLPENQTYFEDEADTNISVKSKGKGCGCCLLMFLGLVALIIYIIYSFFDFLLNLFAI